MVLCTYQLAAEQHGCVEIWLWHAQFTKEGCTSRWDPAPFVTTLAINSWPRSLDFFQSKLFLACHIHLGFRKGAGSILWSCLSFMNLLGMWCGLNVGLQHTTAELFGVLDGQAVSSWRCLLRYPKHPECVKMSGSVVLQSRKWTLREQGCLQITSIREY